MLNPHDRIKLQQAAKRLKRASKFAKRKMAPHMKKFESPTGQYACLLVSGVALMVAAEQENPGYLEAVTRQASDISGIPLGAMTAHTEFILALFTGAMLAQQTTTAAGGGNNA